MAFDTALRLSEIALALALLQRGAEHLPRHRAIFLPQILLAFLLLAGVGTVPVLVGLWGLGVAQLHRFDGPYNGGADKMAMLILTCLTLAHLPVAQHWRELALAYLAVQLVLSYFMSGWVKLRNPDWRSGQALGDVFALSPYPVSAAMRRWAGWPRSLRAGSWAVIGLEVVFPLSLLHPLTLAGALSAAAAFHLANALCFGLNRFVWIWLAAYPALIWFQGRVI